MDVERTPETGKEEDRRRVRIVVSGRVQGVWFRESTRETAEALGLVGTVRNLLTGEVEIIAEGPRHRLEALAVWARRGPSAARVDHITEEYSPATGSFSEFRVIR